MEVYQIVLTAPIWGIAVVSMAVAVCGGVLDIEPKARAHFFFIALLYFAAFLAYWWVSKI